MDADRTLLFPHAALRLIPPHAEGSARWSVHDLLRRTTYELGPAACQTLVAFSGGRRALEVAEDLSERLGKSRQDVLDAAARLAELGLLAPGDHAEHRFADRIQRSWDERGWSAAAEHHLATWNFPYLDYLEKHHDMDRMDEYLAEEPDLDRCKAAPPEATRVPLPTAADAVNALEVPLDVAWSGAAPRRPLALDTVGTIVSGTFGVLRRRSALRKDREAEYLRKTSPSGGARHPTEGYLVAIAVDGLAPGLYHHAVAEHALARVGEPLSPAVLERVFPGPMRAPFRVGALVVMTTVFERNMYRYREPRTYRSLMMDVGHIQETLSVISSGCGISSHDDHDIDLPEAERVFGLRPLREGVICATALGGGDP